MISLRTRAGSRIMIAAIALALPPAFLSAAERLQSGQWEFTTSNVSGEKNSVKSCISAEEAASINGDSKTARAYAEKKAGSRCTVNEYTISGNSTSYSLTCGEVTIKARITHHGDTSEGDLVSKKGAEPEVVTHMKARRLGDCPPGAQTHR